MPKPANWSSRSDACRIELRPSRACAAGLVSLGVLGAASWWLSAAHIAMAVAGSIAWVGGAVLLASREMRRKRCVLVLSCGGDAMLDGQPIGDVTVDWRGPLHVLSWREKGRMVRWMAFPDVLDSGARRELRLWSRRRREHAGAAAVAP